MSKPQLNKHRIQRLATRKTEPLVKILREIVNLCLIHYLKEDWHPVGKCTPIAPSMTSWYIVIDCRLGETRQQCHLKPAADLPSPSGGRSTDDVKQLILEVD